MRLLKFRAWDKVNNRMGYFEKGFQWCDEYNIWHLSSIGESIMDVPCNKNIIWMQFTGLKDKNGKEICEGDICVSRGFGKGEVIFERGKFALRIAEVDFTIGDMWHGAYKKGKPDYSIINVEVIGNIYQKLETEDNCELEQCEYCYCMKPHRGFQTVQIRKWKDDKTNGIRRICKRCQLALFGEYKVKVFVVNSRKEFLEVIKKAPRGTTVIWHEGQMEEVKK